MCPPGFVISASHKSEQGNPPLKDLFHFATASEQAWTLYKLNEIQAQLGEQSVDRARARRARAELCVAFPTNRDMSH